MNEKDYLKDAAEQLKEIDKSKFMGHNIHSE